MKSIFLKALIAVALVSSNHLMVTAQAQTPTQREVTLSASAQQAVAQDWLRIRMAARLEGENANAVQTQLKQALQRALLEVTPMASAEDMQVQTDGFSMHLRYQNGRANGWVGEAGLVLEGRDFGLIGQASARLTTLNVTQVALSLSAALDRRTREQVQLEAIAAFRNQAQAVAKAFGFDTYDLVDVRVGGDRPNAPSSMLMGMAMASDAQPVPVAASMALVSVQVSGRIRLR